MFEVIAVSLFAVQMKGRRGLGTHLRVFIKVPRPRDSEGTFSVFESSYQSNHSKVDAISLSTLPKDTKSELASLSSHYPILMLNVKSEAVNTNF